MITDFQNIFVFNITLKDVVGNVFVAMLCGVIIALIYRWTYKGLNYSSAFNISLVMLTMITAIVIMVIGNNLARAFGMVGAMSIIRFRTAVKDATDIMFIFFALSIGLAAGVKLYSVAVFGTLFVGGLFLIINKFAFTVPKSREFLLQIIVNSHNMPDNPFDSLMQKYCKKHKVINVKTLGEDENETMELSYYINLRKEDKGRQLVAHLKRQEGVKQVNLFFDED